MKILTTLFIILISQSVFADTQSDSDKLFDWAETNLPEYLSPANQPSDTYDNVWYYRYYPSTDIYLTTNTDDLDVYVLGDVFGGLLRIDTLGAVMTSAGLKNTDNLSDGNLSPFLSLNSSSRTGDVKAFAPYSFLNQSIKSCSEAKEYFQGKTMKRCKEDYSPGEVWISELDHNGVKWEVIFSNDINNKVYAYNYTTCIFGGAGCISFVSGSDDSAKVIYIIGDSKISDTYSGNSLNSLSIFVSSCIEVSSSSESVCNKNIDVSRHSSNLKNAAHFVSKYDDEGILSMEYAYWDFESDFILNQCVDKVPYIQYEVGDSGYNECMKRLDTTWKGSFPTFSLEGIVGPNF